MRPQAVGSELVERKATVFARREDLVQAGVPQVVLGDRVTRAFADVRFAEDLRRTNVVQSEPQRRFGRRCEPAFL